MPRSFLLFAFLLFAFLLCLPSAAQAQRLDRLEKLAARLDTVGPGNFSIHNWGTGDPDSPDYLGCAAGHATAIFAADGFRYESRARYAPIVYEGRKSLEATKAFFELDYQDNVFLFTPRGGAGRDPKFEAENIRKVVAKHRAKHAVVSNR